MTPTQPTILDALGNQLEVGMQVKHTVCDSEERTNGVVTWASRRLVDVTWIPSAATRTYRVEHQGLIRRTFTCPDLKAVLTPDPEEKP